MEQHEKPWQTFSVRSIADLFADASFPWWIAGGIALELALGYSIRTHSDIDILVLRRDQHKIRNTLASWDCWVADPPGTLRFWPETEALEDQIHDVWCRESAEAPWQFQLMLDESDGDAWISRRNNTLRAPLASLTRTTLEGIPYLAPHIQLFYKAKQARDKDEVDLYAVLDSEVNLDVAWLRAAITLCYGKEHPWLSLLSS
jgi:hypothetical protein